MIVSPSLQLLLSGPNSHNVQLHITFCGNSKGNVTSLEKFTVFLIRIYLISVVASAWRYPVFLKSTQTLKFASPALRPVQFKYAHRSMCKTQIVWLQVHVGKCPISSFLGNQNIAAKKNRQLTIQK